MGYCQVTYDYLIKQIKKVGFELQGLKMCELGNQYLFHFPKGNRVGRPHFESLGIEYTSIDWNGKDGALKLDLTEPIDIGQFDVVTNYGTSEHVEDQEACFLNIHNLCRVGGIMVHNLPKEGNWMKHSRVYKRYSIDDFKKLAKKYKYKILDLQDVLYKEDPKKRSIWCTLRRNE